MRRDGLSQTKGWDNQGFFSNVMEEGRGPTKTDIRCSASHIGRNLEPDFSALEE